MCDLATRVCNGNMGYIENLEAWNENVMSRFSLDDLVCLSIIRRCLRTEFCYGIVHTYPDPDLSYKFFFFNSGGNGFGTWFWCENQEFMEKVGRARRVAE